MPTLEEKVKQIFVEQLGVDVSELNDNAAIVDDLGADSLDEVELVMAFEEAFDVEIVEANAASKVRTVGDAISYMRELLKHRPEVCPNCKGTGIAYAAPKS